MKNIYKVNTQNLIHKNKGVKDDLQVRSLGDWTISSSLKYLEILIHGIIPGKDILDKVRSYRYLSPVSYARATFIVSMQMKPIMCSTTTIILLNFS